MLPIKKVSELFTVFAIVLSLLILCGCGQNVKNELSANNIKDFVSAYSPESADTVTAINANKLEMLVNLWKSHEIIDNAAAPIKEQLYGELADKLVKQALAQKTAAEKAAITSAVVSFVYVSKSDEYGKLDFTSMIKKAKVTFAKGSSSDELTRTKVEIQ